MRQLSAQRFDVILLAEPQDGGALPDLCRDISDCTDASVIALTDSSHHTACLQAGADAVHRPEGDEILLLARLRACLRDQSLRRLDVHTDSTLFPADGAELTIVAPSHKIAMSWKRHLAQRLAVRIDTATGMQVLAQASHGNTSDMYLIALDPAAPGEGLALLSELRARPNFRDACCLLLLEGSAVSMAPVGLDLGADDVIEGSPRQGEVINLTAVLVRRHLRRRALMQAQSLQHQQQLRLAYQDPLTGIGNRRAAFRAIRTALGTASGSGVGLLALDLDHFKEVNDRFGHAAGDTALRQAAHCLTQAIDDTGELFRIGGEEFLAILPDTDRTTVLRMGEALRQALASHRIILPPHLGGAHLRITVSVGATHLPSDTSEALSGTEIERIIAAADHALLTAKLRGRDQLVATARRSQAA